MNNDKNNDGDDDGDEEDEEEDGVCWQCDWTADPAIALHQQLASLTSWHTMVMMMTFMTLVILMIWHQQKFSLFIL